LIEKRSFTMTRLMIEGGVPMWFLLGFGLLTLAAAARFAWVADRRWLRITAGLAVTTLFALCTGTVAALSAVGHNASSYVTQHPGTTLVDTLLLGFAESMSAAILGCSMLTLSALFVALGLYREATP
jgi:hypothetical protein